MALPDSPVEGPAVVFSLRALVLVALSQGSANKEQVLMRVQALGSPVTKVGMPLGELVEMEAVEAEPIFSGSKGRPFSRYCITDRGRALLQAWRQVAMALLAGLKPPALGQGASVHRWPARTCLRSSSEP